MRASREEKLPNIFEPLHGCDGAKWGVSDFYEQNEAALLTALRSGEAFDTGWYGVKKEIESGRVYRPFAAPEGMTIYVEASCSDDFDTEGHGEGEVEVIPYEDTADLFDRICKALNKACDSAHENRHENSEVILWSIHTEEGWVETYLQDNSSWGAEKPPGDAYHRWGFQGESVIPKPIRNQIEHKIYCGQKDEIAVGKWTARRCKD